MSSVHKLLNIPQGVPTVRHKAVPQVQVPEGEVPLLDKDKPLQQRFLAKVRLFHLDDPADLSDYEKIWQLVCDGLAQISESRTEFVAEKGVFIALLRWSEFEYKLPST